MLYELDLCAQKSHIGHLAAQGFLCAGPHSGSLDVYADEILLGVQSGQPYGVFASSASQFQDNGVVIVEEVLMPTSFQAELALLEHGKRAFYHQRVLFHVGEFRQFSFSHGLFLKSECG